MLTYSRSLQIEWGDCDPAGIIFYPRYFAMFDHDATMLISKASGLTKPQLLKKYGFAGYPVVKTQAKFISPTTFGDDITIESAFTRVGRSSFEIRHQVIKNGKPAAEGLQTRAFVERDPDDHSKIRAFALPDDLAARFRAEPPASG